MAYLALKSLNPQPNSKHVWARPIRSLPPTLSSSRRLTSHTNGPALVSLQHLVTGREQFMPVNTMGFRKAPAWAFSNYAPTWES